LDAPLSVSIPKYSGVRKQEDNTLATDNVEDLFQNTFQETIMRDRIRDAFGFYGNGDDTIFDGSQLGGNPLSGGVFVEFKILL